MRHVWNRQIIRMKMVYFLLKNWDGYLDSQSSDWKLLRRWVGLVTHRKFHLSSLINRTFVTRRASLLFLSYSKLGQCTKPQMIDIDIQTDTMTCGFGSRTRIEHRRRKLRGRRQKSRQALLLKRSDIVAIIHGILFVSPFGGRIAPGSFISYQHSLLHRGLNYLYLGGKADLARDYSTPQMTGQYS